MLPDFRATVEALAVTVAEREHGAGGSPAAARDFLLASVAAMPVYLRPPMRTATLLFDAWSIVRRGRPFHALPAGQRLAQVEAWEVGPAQMLMRFYVSLALVSLWDD